MQDNLQAMLKQNIRDIHLPNDVSYWPPALGWWLLAGIFLLLLMITVIKLLRHQRNNRYRRIARQALDKALSEWHVDNDSARYVRRANALMRRCLHHALGSETLTSTATSDWVSTLNRITKATLSSAAETALTVQCYQRSPNIDVAMIHPELVRWVTSHQAPKSTTPHPATSLERSHA